MPYAANGKISTSPLEGGVEITADQYNQAISAVLEGKRLIIEGGQMVLAFPAPPEPEPEPELTPEEVEAQKIAAIDAERMLRIEHGSAFAVPDIADPIPLTGRAFDQSVYLALLMRAQGAAAAGITAPVLRLRAGDDVIHMLTPDQMIALISQAMGWFEHIMAVSWAMKDGAAPFEAGIPDDVTDDAYWSQ